ncbi:MAG: thioredoxin domain-containing protein [Anaerolineales bacterium]|nr:thioredoxin domain-containing protein [Anaerolineales bacterium]MCW5856345.1 thioredoxin domain-containing protein [Anaerolineales bacterium]
MPNRLADSNSPYLLQHQHNPVDWYPWGLEALQRAQTEDKPIFLSIGYAACHWCHVMAHESFEDPETAAYLNQHFINIKVDREERPDIDGIYMEAVVALTGSGGWPMSIFLMPDGRPFWGGTYFPPLPSHRMPSFRQVLEHIVGLWNGERDKVEAAGEQLREHLWQPLVTSDNNLLQAEELDKISMALAQAYDWHLGGWGHAPKFPQPMSIEFLLGRSTQGDKLAGDMARHALNAMALGGLYDVVGGGFARYSVDNLWLVPHFEKMLYDNAQLARAYLHGHLVTGDPHFRQVCEETLDFVLRELCDESGGFYSSLDADSEGHEGKFYVWSLEEIKQAIGDPLDRDLLLAAYGVTNQGNFEGKNILQRAKDDAELAEQFSLAAEQIPVRLRAGLDALLAARGGRIRPGTDDKVLTAWNGLMLIAFAEAARYLKRPDYLLAAQRNADFLLTQLQPTGRLLRSWRAGRAAHDAYLEDHAALGLGLLALYQSDPQPRWFAEAKRLAEDMLAHFSDPSGGFYDTRDDAEALITRPKDVQDNATPSGNALAGTLLLQLAAYEGNHSWRQQAESLLASILPQAVRYPTGFAQWLCAAQFALAEGREIALLGGLAEPATAALQETVWTRWRPFDVLAASPVPAPAGSPALLAERPLVDGQPSAYVCRNFACQLPVTTPEALAKQLGS